MLSRSLPMATVDVEGTQRSVDDLWLAYRTTASREDRDHLVLHYLGLVTYVASRVGVPASAAVDHGDLVQSGVIGLMDAVDRFEHGRGVKFETYAVTRIRGAILDALRAQDWVPRSVRRRARDLDTAWQRSAARLGHSPTTADLADELGVTQGQVGDARSLIGRMWLLELDAVADQGPEGAGPCLADPFAEVPGDALDAQSDRDALRDALGSLDPRGRTVLTHSYLDGLTLAQIGVLLGVTESRVCQLRTRALKDLAGRMAALQGA